MSRRIYGVIAIVAGLFAVPALPADGQSLIQTLSPSATAVEARTYVSSVRELEDGRVLVVDQLEYLVYEYSPDLKTARVISRQGQGPAEYQVPVAALPLPNFRTAIVDWGNFRFLLLDSDGRPEGQVLRGQDVTQARGLNASLPTPVIDGSGNWYTAGLPSPPGGGRPFDSIAIERWQMGQLNSADTIGMIPAASPMPGPWEYPFLPSWTACGDGTLFVASPSPYQISVLEDGTQTVGPTIEFEPMEITSTIKDHLESRLQAIPGTTLSWPRNGGAGARVAYYSRPRRGNRTWPKYAPPFPRGGIACGVVDLAWVTRVVGPGVRPTVDVFGRSGERVAVFTLPDGARIVGFGQESVYAVVRDDFDLEYLMKLGVPAGQDLAPN